MSRATEGNVPDAGGAIAGARRRVDERLGLADRALRALAVLLTLCVLLVPVKRVLAGERTADFDGLRAALDRQLGVHGRGVPMMWAVSMLARGFTHDGVRGLRVVAWECVPGGTEGVDRVALERTVRERLGAGWSPMVRERSERETSLVYVQPAGREGKNIRMVVVDVEGNEANLVRMELSPDALLRWQKDGELH